MQNRIILLQKSQKVLPSLNTLYSKIDWIYERTKQTIRNYIDEHPIYFIVDESTDVCKRSVMNVVIDEDFLEPMLLGTIFLEQTNITSVQQSVNQACATLDGAYIPYHTKTYVFSFQINHHTC